MEEGWYLMSVVELERELARLREPHAAPPPSAAKRLSIDEALAYRNAGNLPDPEGRTLRLVLHVGDAAGELDEKRSRYEPDFHDAPHWRRAGSAPVNVVPVRTRDAGREGGGLPWWEQPDMKPLEEEWRATGRVAGITVGADYRSFVFKTVVALRRAGKSVTPDAIANSISRWLPDEEVKRVRASLED